jgi:hypothetical protein
MAKDVAKLQRRIGMGLAQGMGAICLGGLLSLASTGQAPLLAQSSEPAMSDPEATVPPSIWQPQTGTWTLREPGRQDFGKIKVVWLQGTPYEMGYQHGELLKDEIASMGREVINTLNFFGRALGLARLSQRRSFPGVYEECQGLADATADIGMTVEGCMVLALGDVYQVYFGYFLPNVLFNVGCAHFVASGPATADGGFYQGWTLDNDGGPLPYWADNPTVLVRQPTNEAGTPVGIPHVFITVPAMIWPNAAMNAEGIIVSNNTANPQTFEDLDLDGRSTVQLMTQIATQASTFDEAYEIMETNNRMRANLVMVSDAKSRQAGVFELLGFEMGVRELDENGLLYMTNHFLSEEVVGRDVETVSSLNRYASFEQMLEPEGERTRFGRITAEVAVEILRDRADPNDPGFTPSPFDVEDDNASIGGNGSHRQVVFDPLNLRFWMTNSEQEPIPTSPFVCFSVGELLGLSDYTPCDPVEFPAQALTP